MKQTISISQPATLRPEILSDGRYVIRSSSPRGTCLIAYDPRTLTAGVFHYDAEMWSLWTPLPLAEFLNSLGGRGYALPEGEDLQVWLDAVAELAGVTRQ